jgi:hypothetical protein
VAHIPLPCDVLANDQGWLALEDVGGIMLPKELDHIGCPTERAFPHLTAGGTGTA